LFPDAGISSTKEFHCPQSGHRPIHFGAWYPQLWQIKMNLGFFFMDTIFLYLTGLVNSNPKSIHSVTVGCAFRLTKGQSRVNSFFKIVGGKEMEYV